MICGPGRYVAMPRFSAENDLKPACQRHIICQRNERLAEVDVTSAPNVARQTQLGVEDRGAKGVMSPCSRSLTLVEDSRNPVEEMEGVTRCLCRPTAGPSSCRIDRVIALLRRPFVE
jgi:hypothetical protein